MSFKILLTGGSGRIAQWIIPFLPADFELVVTDRQAGETGGRKIQALDITDYDAVLAAMQGVDAVVHLAIMSERHIITDKALFDADEGEEYIRFNEASIEVNVRGTYHILEAARAAGVKRVVLGSSLTVLLGKPVYTTFHDDLPVRPFNFYAVTKLWTEQLGEFFSRRHGLTVYCLRFGQPREQELARRVGDQAKGRPPSKALVSSQDLAWAIECALTCANGPAFGAYTIVSDSEDRTFDNTKAAEIGWRPKTRCGGDCSVTVIC